MYCPQCGNRIKRSESFCSWCGYRTAGQYGVGSRQNASSAPWIIGIITAVIALAAVMSLIFIAQGNANNASSGGSSARQIVGTWQLASHENETGKTDMPASNVQYTFFGNGTLSTTGGNVGATQGAHWGWVDQDTIKISFENGDSVIWDIAFGQTDGKDSLTVAATDPNDPNKFEKLTFVEADTSQSAGANGGGSAAGQIVGTWQVVTLENEMGTTDMTAFNNLFAFSEDGTLNTYEGGLDELEVTGHWEWVDQNRLKFVSEDSVAFMDVTFGQTDGKDSISAVVTNPNYPDYVETYTFVRVDGAQSAGQSSGAANASHVEEALIVGTWQFTDAVVNPFMTLTGEQIAEAEPVVLIAKPPRFTTAYPDNEAHTFWVFREDGTGGQFDIIEDIGLSSSSGFFWDIAPSGEIMIATGRGTYTLLGEDELFDWSDDMKSDLERFRSGDYSLVHESVLLTIKLDDERLYWAMEPNYVIDVDSLCLVYDKVSDNTSYLYDTLNALTADN